MFPEVSGDLKQVLCVYNFLVVKMADNLMVTNSITYR